MCVTPQADSRDKVYRDLGLKYTFTMSRCDETEGRAQPQRARAQADRVRAQPEQPDAAQQDAAGQADTRKKGKGAKKSSRCATCSHHPDKQVALTSCSASSDCVFVLSCVCGVVSVHSQVALQAPIVE